MAEAKEAKLGVSGTQATGSALAAVTSAVLLSTLGVAGTLIGAAVSSLVFTFGGVLYTRSVQAGKHHVQQAADSAKGRVQQARTRKRGLPTGSNAEKAAEQELVEVQEALEEVENTTTEHGPADQDSWRQRLRDLPWKRIIFVSVGVFIVVMVAITAFELAVGRSVSSFTGGSGSDGARTTIPIGRDSGSSDHNNPQDNGDTGNDGTGNGSNPSDGNDPDQGEQNQSPGQDPTPTEQAPGEQGPEPPQDRPDEPNPGQEAPDRSQHRPSLPDEPGLKE